MFQKPMSCHHICTRMAKIIKKKLYQMIVKMRSNWNCNSLLVEKRQFSRS